VVQLFIRDVSFMLNVTFSVPAAIEEQSDAATGF
jgi:starvation-inducible outer membrane lipoprotein